MSCYISTITRYPRQLVAILFRPRVLRLSMSRTANRLIVQLMIYLSNTNYNNNHSTHNNKHTLLAINNTFQSPPRICGTNGIGLALILASSALAMRRREGKCS